MVNFFILKKTGKPIAKLMRIKEENYRGRH
jgi:hypothetical protein